jgi:hypothetical protein
MFKPYNITLTVDSKDKERWLTSFCTSLKNVYPSNKGLVELCNLILKAIGK